MNRIQQLEQYAHPADYAYSSRSDGNNLTIHEFERVGGGRELKYAKWNTKYIESLTEEEFEEILLWAEVRIELFRKYSQPMSIFEFFQLTMKGTLTP